MPIQQWSDNIVLATLEDDPQFSDELASLTDLAEQRRDVDIVLDLSGVNFLNSSNIAKLLRLRKVVVGNNGRQLKLCAIRTQVWGVFLVTGLDQVFDFADDVASGLASLQMQADR